ncbi:MAG TPA: nuclear transport factor 2 family protein [Actinophytocola sp.]|uniref:ester cyclase n=1 Tax=Actinophytocola sp. TaxID=1872138 RepID=UPI002DDCFA98|nr:nuclear transport factor 2 family protein [Actinophytocola sp.]HEV2783942.1 nuclear transport factor 2 family protein [Actinophytocola sp.]
MTTPQSGDRQVATALVDRWLDAFNSYDATAFAACYTEDAVLEDAALKRFFRGRTELAEFITVWVQACPDTYLKLEKVVIGDGGAAVAWTGVGTLSGTFPHLPPTAVRGSRIEQRGLSLMEFSETGLIKAQTDYWDSFTVLRQIGVIPE